MKKKKKSSEAETPLETPKGRKEKYCFPDYGISVMATSQEEAERKLKELIKED